MKIAVAESDGACSQGLFTDLHKEMERFGIAKDAMCSVFARIGVYPRLEEYFIH